MFKKVVLFLLMTPGAFAGDLYVAGSISQGSESDKILLVQKAIAGALRSLPNPNMVQHSPWKTSVFLAGGAGRWYGSAAASFRDPSQSAPWFLRVSGATDIFWDLNKAPELIDVEKAALLRKGSFYCNGPIAEPVEWSEKINDVGAPGTPVYQIHLSSQLRCQQ